ncbi:MAG: hypothetical protein E7365_03505 [Clostridiales bacterium]|nr:hypothetical protein [Clostridiales bacterium]
MRKGEIIMKKIIIFMLIVIVAVVGIFNLNLKQDIVRIHIRANSDSESDQATKLLVRDKVNEYLAPVLEQLETKEQAVEVLTQQLPELQKIAQDVSKTDCNVTLGQEYFPRKNYNGTVYPEGEYTALIIEIGEGAGRNWWCVAFPNMCYTTSEKKVEYKSFFVEILERLGVL